MTKLTDYQLSASAVEYLGIAQNTIGKWVARWYIQMYWNPANGYRLLKRYDLDTFQKAVAWPAMIHP